MRRDRNHTFLNLRFAIFPQPSSAQRGSYFSCEELGLRCRIARRRRCLKLPRPAGYCLKLRIFSRRRRCLKLPRPAALDFRIARRRRCLKLPSPTSTARISGLLVAAAACNCLAALPTDWISGLLVAAAAKNWLAQLPTAWISGLLVAAAA